ncbi:Potassium-transporting ATPase ATP-binding subunit [Candidatus Anstonella stagnisolia]|nr:Potassium-transporting ATPase ATP-binding subunit [Candidatus Anstonella stagnisolia]
MAESAHFHSVPISKALSISESSEGGLSADEAQKRLSTYGKNILVEVEGPKWPKIFVAQFSNPLIIMLTLAASLSFYVGKRIDASAICVAVLISVLFGFLQEYKAESALAALKSLTNPKALVVRGKKEKLIDARELVPGDILLVSEGDKIPADCRVLENANLAIDQSSLTGESHAVHKSLAELPLSTPLAERSNMLYAGTVVVRGHGKALVSSTGKFTEFGKIASSLSATEEEQAPLQRSLAELGRKIGIVAIMLSVLFFAFGVLRAEPIDQMFVVAISLAVAAIPEGLPTIITITLAVGVQAMSKQKAIVRKLPAVETLGSTTVICTDKTGTLTQNRMTVTRLWVENSTFEFDGIGLEGGKMSSQKEGDLQLAKKALQIGALCNTASFVYEGEKLSSIAGDPTEAAILIAAQKAGIDAAEERTEYKLLGEVPFDSERKLMSVVRNMPDGAISFVKGAPECMFPRCKKLLTPEGEVPFSPQISRRLHAKAEEFSSDALRVLALAYKRVKAKEHYTHEETEHDLVFVGFVGMMDPPRKEVAGAIEKCRRAGIRVIMVTGDSRPTAVAVALKVGLMAEGEDERVLSGEEIDSLDDYRLSQRLLRAAVCCRTTPVQKLRIVSTLSKKGEVVAVTGDGVNDAPALKRAGVGIAMGITGSEVAKEVSDIVLLDDNFATIVSAIEHGRAIFRNIKSFVRYQFSTAVAAMAAMFIPPFLGLPLPMSAIQILWVNIIMDGPPALALGAEPSSEGEMDKPPRDSRADFVSRNLLLSIATTGIFMAAVMLFTLWLYLQISPEKATTIAFTTFVGLQLANALNCKSPDKSLLQSFFSNKYLILAIVLSIALQLCIIYLHFFQGIFGTVALGTIDLLYVCGIGFVLILAGEVKKRFLKEYTRY